MKNIQPLNMTQNTHNSDPRTNVQGTVFINHNDIPHIATRNHYEYKFAFYLSISGTVNINAAKESIDKIQDWLFDNIGSENYYWEHGQQNTSTGDRIIIPGTISFLIADDLTAFRLAWGNILYLE